MHREQRQDNKMMIYGSCLCEQIKFSTLNSPQRFYQCHCSLCRKQTGTQANAAFIVNQPDFNWLTGMEYISTYKKPSGFTSCFCSNCGSPVPNQIGSSHFIWIPIGLLDNPPENLAPALHLHMKSKAVWDSVNDSIPQFETMPTLDEIANYLHDL